MSAGSPPRPEIAPAAVQGTVLENHAPEVARTYAEALINAASKAGQADAVLDDLDAIVAEVWRPFPQFANLLTSPAVQTHDKERILRDTFEGKVTPLVARFLHVLNRHGRLNLLPAIARQGRAIWDRRQNRVYVTVRSASPLDEGQQAALHERLARLTGGAVPIVRLEVDPALIGGLVVQIGDDVYDASVRNRLEQLRRKLIEGKTHEIQSRRDHFSDPA
jgi:F-type H+-transporting ATPase subunit delta